MSTSLWLYLGLTVTLAGVLLSYVANVWRALDRSSGGGLRWNAIVLAPMRAWQLGARALPVAFGGLVLLYALLWLSTPWVLS